MKERNKNHETEKYQVKLWQYFVYFIRMNARKKRKKAFANKKDDFFCGVFKVLLKRRQHLFHSSVFFLLCCGPFNSHTGTKWCGDVWEFASNVLYVHSLKNSWCTRRICVLRHKIIKFLTQKNIECQRNM